ncbi:MAG: helix-turn-helix domain-containing protein [Elusimicrobiaceae bacterium]|nr:helix-turn-helix domain-containing protein [Elusimicrobiaceae bacterium]
MRRHRTYTVSQKVKIYTYYQKHGWKATGKKYDLPRATFATWKQRVKKGGAPLAVLLARSPKRHTVCKEVEDLVRKLRAKHPELSLNALQQKVAHIQRISRSTVWRIVSGK